MRIQKEIPNESIDRLYLPILNNFIEFLASEQYYDTPIQDITEHMIRKYFTKSKILISNATLLNRFRALKIYFDFLYSNGLAKHVFKNIDINEFTTVTKLNKEINVSARELDKFYEYVDDKSNDIYERLLIAFIIYQGLSKGEICLLSRDKIDLDFGYIYTRKTLKKETKKKILVLKVQNLIREYISRNKIDFKSSLLGYSGNADSMLNKDIGNISKRIIGRKVTPTDLREAFRAKLINKDKSSIMLISLFMNESISNTITFANKCELLYEEELEEQIRSLTSIG